MTDETEALRLQRLVEINSEAGDRPALEAKYGQVWNTQQLRDDFEVIGFAAPLVVVRRKADGVKGSLEFRHQPRLYFNFAPHAERERQLMILRKITTGFVVQKFDSETGRCLSQEFVAGE